LQYVKVIVYRHDITEILLKEALKIITLTPCNYLNIMKYHISSRNYNMYMSTLLNEKNLSIFCFLILLSLTMINLLSRVYTTKEGILNWHIICGIYSNIKILPATPSTWTNQIKVSWSEFCFVDIVNFVSTLFYFFNEIFLSIFYFLILLSLTMINLLSRVYTTKEGILNWHHWRSLEKSLINLHKYYQWHVLLDMDISLNLTYCWKWC
jgi:hypothetical protein